MVQYLQFRILKFPLIHRFSHCHVLLPRVSAGSLHLVRTQLHCCQTAITPREIGRFWAPLKQQQVVPEGCTETRWELDQIGTTLFVEWVCSRETLWESTVSLQFIDLKKKPFSRRFNRPTRQPRQLRLSPRANDLSFSGLETKHFHCGHAMSTDIPQKLLRMIHTRDPSAKNRPR